MMEGEVEKKIEVKHFLIGGDVLKYSLVKDILKNKFGNMIITNTYGPTECTVDSISFTIDSTKINDVKYVKSKQHFRKKLIWSGKECYYNFVK
jgi:non-ribosomal peptide synthetase component F